MVKNIQVGPRLERASFWDAKKALSEARYGLSAHGLLWGRQKKWQTSDS